MQALITRMHELCDAEPFDTGWYLKDLRSGAEFDRRGDVVVPSASTRKIAILMTALRAVNQGRLKLDQPVTVEAKYQATQFAENGLAHTKHSGCLLYLQPGFTVQLRDLIVLMIIVSDNTATGIVSDMLGLDAINEFSQSVGMKNTAHRTGTPAYANRANQPVDQQNATTPRDVGLLLDLIQQGATNGDVAEKLGCTPELCQLGLDILSWQRVLNRLPSQLPIGTKIAHKTGEAARGHNDAGIIYRDDEPRFILTVFTHNVPIDAPDNHNFAAVHQLTGRLARECWDALQ